MASTLFLLCALVLISQTKSFPNATTSNRRRIDFHGKSYHSVRIKKPKSSSIQQNLPKWLKSNHSHVHLLGSSQVSRSKDGMYKSVLPSLSWFGMELIPTFFQRITFKEYNDDDDSLAVNVSIEDSQVSILGKGEEDFESSNGGLIEKIMAKCSFRGGNEIRCSPIGDDWELSSQLTLKLEVPLTSRLIILPPGMNSIGSRIVRKETEKKVKENLTQLVKEYHASYASK
jgi:hypothetical protein